MPDLVPIAGGSVSVFLGSLNGDTSPVPTSTPLLGAEVRLRPSGYLSIAVDPGFEHGVLVDAGPVQVGEAALARGELGYLAPGREHLIITNPTTDPARVILLGGTPFEEPILMWWNFVGRSHEEIVAFREEWQQGSARFGHVEGYVGYPQRLPAPPLPSVRIKPRFAPPGPGDRSAWG